MLARSDDGRAWPSRGRRARQEKGTDADGEAAQLNEEEQLLVIGRLHQVLRPFMLRRTKAEVETELPGKAEHVVRCGLSAWQHLWYRQIAEEVRMTSSSIYYLSECVQKRFWVAPVVPLDR